MTDRQTKRRDRKERWGEREGRERTGGGGWFLTPSQPCPVQASKRGRGRKTEKRFLMGFTGGWLYGWPAE